MREFLGKLTSSTLDAIAKHLGTYLLTVICPVCLFLFTKIKLLQSLAAVISPKTWLFTVSCLILIMIMLLVMLFKQYQTLKRLKRERDRAGKKIWMVTHYGLWWKLYPEESYMEDFPYCPCCDPPRKLIQIEWNPEEKFRCSTTTAEFQLFDGIPRKLDEARKYLREGYFNGGQIITHFFKEYERLKALFPEKIDTQIMRIILKEYPFRRLPNKERELLLKRFDNPTNLARFFKVNSQYYIPLLNRFED